MSLTGIIPAESLLAAPEELLAEISKLTAQYNRDIADLQKLIDKEDQILIATKASIEEKIKKQDIAMAMVDQLNKLRKLYD